MTEDLRQKLNDVIRRVRWWSHAGDLSDALMPVIREALAQAWDDGWGAAVHHLTNGDTIIFRPADHPNPWRGEA